MARRGRTAPKGQANKRSFDNFLNEVKVRDEVKARGGNKRQRRWKAEMERQHAKLDLQYLKEVS